MNKNRSTVICKLFLLVLVFHHGYAGEFIPGKKYFAKFDSLFATSETLTWIDRVDEIENTFFVGTIGTLDHPYQSVLQASLDLLKYEKIYDIIDHSILISDSINLDSVNIFYNEVHVGISSSWSVVNCRQIKSIDNSEARFLCVQNHDTDLNVKWEKHFKRKWRMFGSGTDNSGSMLILKKLSGNKTRMSWITWLTPDFAPPKWLFSLACKFAFPSLIKDMDRYLEKSRYKH